MTTPDYMADYREAQAAGHHRDCDGWRTSHRVEIVPTDHGKNMRGKRLLTFQAVCDECGPLGIGSTGSPDQAVRLSSGHATEVRCDLRCREWGNT